MLLYYIDMHVCNHIYGYTFAQGRTSVQAFTWSRFPSIVELKVQVVEALELQQ